MTMAMTQHDIELLREDKRREERRERSQRANLHGPVEGCDGGPWEEEPAEAPCQECGAICPVEDMDNVWVGSGYEMQCTVCSRAVFDEAAPEFWDTREEYES